MSAFLCAFVKNIQIKEAVHQRIKQFCTPLTFMSFQTHVTDFLLLNTKADVCQNVHAAHFQLNSM